MKISAFIQRLPAILKKPLTSEKMTAACVCSVFNAFDNGFYKNTC